MHLRVQITSIAFAALVLFGVFELVRRGRLRERYALLWLAAGVILLVLAVRAAPAEDDLDRGRDLLPAERLLRDRVRLRAAAVAALLHDRVRLGDETRVLAQRLALLEEKLRAAEPRPGAADALVETTTEPPAEHRPA